MREDLNLSASPILKAMRIAMWGGTIVCVLCALMTFFGETTAEISGSVVHTIKGLLEGGVV